MGVAPAISVVLQGQPGPPVIADVYMSMCQASNIDEIVCGQRFWTKRGYLKKDDVAQRHESVQL